MNHGIGIIPSVSGRLVGDKHGDKRNATVRIVCSQYGVRNNDEPQGI